MKKLLIISILAVFMLVAISFATVVSSNTTTTKKKESPLFGIRTRLAIGERVQNLKENIKARFVGERMFYLPFQWLRLRDSGLLSREDTYDKASTCGFTFSCFPLLCGAAVISVLVCKTVSQPECDSYT